MTDDVRIANVEPDDHELNSLWNQYVASNGLPPQARIEWKQILEQVFGARCMGVSARDDSGKVCGIALVFFKPGEETLYSCRYGFHADNQEIARILCKEIQSIAQKNNLNRSVITSGNAEYCLSDKAPERTSLYLPLDYADEEALWLSVPQKTKNMIRKAGKTGIRIVSDWKYLDDFYAIYAARFCEKSIGIKPLGLFQSISNLFADDAVFIGALQEDKLVAGTIYIAAGEVVSYAYNASNLDTSSNGANNLVMWEAMKYFHSRGAKYIDLSESTPDSPVYKYKTRLSKNIEIRPVYYYDFLGEWKKSGNTTISPSLFLKYKVRGALHRLLPVMSPGLKRRYLQHLGMGGRIL